MYCTVTEKASKRKPESSGIYRNPRAKIVYNPAREVGKALYSVQLEGENEVEREAKQKWTFTLNDSKRVDGKVVKKQWNIATFTFWDFVDEYMRIEAQERLGFHSILELLAGKSST